MIPKENPHQDTKKTTCPYCENPIQGDPKTCPTCKKILRLHINDLPKDVLGQLDPHTKYALTTTCKSLRNRLLPKRFSISNIECTDIAQNFYKNHSITGGNLESIQVARIGTDQHLLLGSSFCSVIWQYELNSHQFIQEISVPHHQYRGSKVETLISYGKTYLLWNLKEDNKNYVIVWDLQQNEQIKKIASLSHKFLLTTIDGERCLILYGDHKVIIRDPLTDKIYIERIYHYVNRETVIECAILLINNKKYLVVAVSDTHNQIKILDLEKEIFFKKFSFKARVTHLAILNNHLNFNTYLVWALSDQTIIIVDPLTGNTVKSFKTNGDITLLATSPNGFLFFGTMESFYIFNPYENKHHEITADNGAKLKGFNLFSFLSDSKMLIADSMQNIYKISWTNTQY